MDKRNQPQSVKVQTESAPVSLDRSQSWQGSVANDASSGTNPQPPHGRNPDESLSDLFRDWVQRDSNRSTQYRLRVDAAWANLKVDIARWREAKVAHRVVSHHIEQFGTFAEKAKDALLKESEKQDASNQAEALDFRALVIGVFTAQWFLLRNVAEQRTGGHPYYRGVDELDTLVRANYARLYRVMNPKLKVDKQNRQFPTAPLLPFAPLAYLGNAGELTVFNRRIPLLLSVPLAALQPIQDATLTPDEHQTALEQMPLARMAVPHEIAHALFAQIPELIIEIRTALERALQNGEIKSPKSGGELSAREIVIYRSSFEWLEEICADLFGTALGGEAFVNSALRVMFSSEETVGITDKAHPPAIIRPLVHLLALSTLEAEDKRFEATRNQFDKDIQNASAQGSGEVSLNRRFRSVPALIFVNLETVRYVLNDIVTRILGMELATLGGITLRALLKEIYELDAATLPDPPQLPAWGNDPSITSEQFVLDFPADVFPTYMTPGVSIRPGGEVIPIINAIIHLLGG